MKYGLAMTALAASFTVAAPAHARIEEARFAIAAHNIRFVGDERAPKEPGPQYEADLVFSSPEWLEFLGRPHPYVMASMNGGNGTNWAGVGLYWHIQLSENWRFEPGFGYVVHDGDIDAPYPAGDPRREEYKRTHILFGSRDLFRDTFALERALGEHASLALYFEHLSHGQILGQGRNQGTEELGLRVGYRF